MKRSIVLGLAILTVGSTVAQAFESTPRVDRRQDRQQWRIDQGVEDGSLTRREAKQLRRQARQIRQLEEMALSDRHLHPAEVDMLQDALNDLSDRIYEAKHNDRYRFSHRQQERRFGDRSRYENSWRGHLRMKQHSSGNLGVGKG